MSRTKAWYASIRKPSFAPPAWVFGPVWTLLYVLIAVSFGYTAYVAYQGSIPTVLLTPFALNLVANLAYSPIQFGLRNLLLATVDILLVLATLIVAIVQIHPYVSWVAYINIPYLLWVCFATLLQLTITAINRDRWFT